MNFTHVIKKTFVSAAAIGLLSAQFGGTALAKAPDQHKPANKDSFSLRIMETTDVHTNIVPYDYFKDAQSDSVGLAKTATLIKQARKEADNSVLVDNGDLIQGTPLGTYKAKIEPLKIFFHPCS